ncbi:MAG: hypothetical protein E6I84_01920 [Chloroflexi bacterium]|nr:MAG: hypothetical protein E6J32_02330 [Chloroflexota bacterium]TMD68304.1 MAG: hypothetical protein E6I84_01920 [Chloroflexota bacterium]
MPNYLLAYHGGGGMAQDQAERDKLMAKWGKWFQDLGPALVDGGNPVMRAKTITSKGSVSEGGGQNPISGYSLIKANDLESAVKLAGGCPVLSGGGSVEVGEVVPAM